MKLKELFQKTPITEDIALPFNSEYQPEFDPSYSKIVGTANSYDIWGSRYYGDASDVYGILDSNQKPMAYVIIKEVDSYYEVFKIWVDRQHRSKSLAITLLYFLTKKVKIKLLSGKLVTNLGKEFLQRLMSNTKFNISVVDKNYKFISKNFDDALKDKSNQLLIEHTDIGDDRLFGHSKFIFRNQIMKEYDLFKDEL